MTDNINFKYDINNNNNNLYINNNKYIRYNNDLLHNTNYLNFLTDFFNYLIIYKHYNIIKELIHNLLYKENNPFRYDYDKIKDYDILNQKKYNNFICNYKYNNINLFLKKDNNIFNNISYNKLSLINPKNILSNIKIKQQFIDKFKNIDNMILFYNSIDNIYIKKFIYVKQYEEYLYNSPYIFNI